MIKKFVPLAGRILISAIFIMSGLAKVFDFAGIQQYMSAFGMPMTSFFLIGAIVLEIGAGLSILLGYKARWGAIALIVFLIPASLIFHTKFSDQVQMIMFMKNMAIMGGLLMVFNFGPGPLSLDNKKGG